MPVKRAPLRQDGRRADPGARQSPRPPETIEPVRIEEHLGLARWVALSFIKWQGKTVGRERLEDTEEYADALVGLAIAAERFDPSRGFKFATYATWWLRQQVQRGIEIRRKAQAIPFSELELPGDKESSPFEQLLAAQEDVTATEVDHHFHRFWRLLDLIDDARDRRVLFKRIMGVGLREVAEQEVPPLCKERIRQIESRALKRLRSELRARGVRNANSIEDFRLCGDAQQGHGAGPA